MAILKIGFTGTRTGMTRQQEHCLKSELIHLQHMTKWDAFEFHHGDCIGADKEARNIAFLLKFKIHCHPPSDPSFQAFTESDVDYPPIPYKDRNRRIVFLTDYLFVAPKEYPLRESGGTYYTFNHAKQQGSYKKTFLIKPDGIGIKSDNWDTLQRT